MDSKLKTALLAELHETLASEAFKGLKVTAIEFTVSVKATVVDPRDGEEGTVAVAYSEEEEI